MSWAMAAASAAASAASHATLLARVLLWRYVAFAARATVMAESIAANRAETSGEWFILYDWSL